MKLLIVAPRFPYPIEKGDKLRLYYQIKELSKFFDIYLFAISEIQVDYEHEKELQSYCQQIRVVDHGKLEIIKQLCRAVLQGEAFQLAYFKNNHAKNALVKFVEEIKPHHIYCQLLRSVYYVEEMHINKTLDLMDAFSYGMEKRSTQGNFITKMLYKREAKILRNREKLVNKNFNNITVISDQDALRLFYVENIKVINNGVELEYFHLTDSHKKHDVVFVGNLGYYPNVKAVKYLFKKIVPRYNLQMAEKLKVGIYGARPTNELLSLDNEYFRIYGWVDDIRKAYSSGQIMVAPIFGGMGQQNKILEAMALGIPSLVSPEIAQGLNLTHEEQVLICQNPDEFATAITQLKSDKKLYNKLRARARLYVETNFSWEKVTRPLVDIIKGN